MLKGADKSNIQSTDKNVNLDELVRAVRILRKAKKHNIPLSSSSCESVALNSLRLHTNRSWSDTLRTLRWTSYFIIWTIAIVYLIALINRVSICRWSATPDQF